MELTYNLPDSEMLGAAIEYLSSSDERIVPYFAMSCFVPEKSCLCIGQSNKPELSIDLQLAEADDICILKRPSGGEAVFLSAQSFVISFVVIADKIVRSAEAFQWILHRIIATLEAQGITGVNLRGISDLAIGNQKILGCSIYRRPHLLFYHAVLNVAEEPELIAKYLLPPARQPEYRLNRSHSEFVTSLLKQGYRLDNLHLERELDKLCYQDWHEMLVSK